MPTQVDEIKDRLDAVELIGRYVPLKKAGRTFKGLCPFHAEKTPSFIVYPEDGHYHCFGCGQGGDIFTFVMKMENLEFGEALRSLADRAGVTLVERPQAVAEDRARERLREITEAAAKYFHNVLLRSPQAQPARDLLARRGVSPETIAAWELGYALDSWDALTGYLLSRGYTADDLVAAGLARARAPEHAPHEGADGGDASVEANRVYDYFRGRVIFPIRDVKGRVTGFGARTLGSDQPKFLNSPQTPLFDKSATLYGIDRAREAIRSAGQAVIVEGYLDVLIAHQMGISNVVASLGTALTERQLAHVKRLGKSLVLALDADSAGDEATMRGLSVAREVMDHVAVPVATWRGLVHFEYRLDADLRILSLPRGEDPDEVLLRSVDEWRELVRQAAPVVDFYFRQITGRLDLTSPKGKAAAVEQLLPLIKEIDSQVAQAHYVSRLATLVQVDERMLASRLRAMRGTVPAAAARPQSAPPSAERRVPNAEDYCLVQILRRPSLLATMTGLSEDDFQDAANRGIFLWMSSQAAAGIRFEASEIRAGLDSALHPRLDALMELVATLPRASEDDVANEALVSAIRVRLAARKAQLERISFALRDPETVAEPDQKAELTRASDGMRQEIGQLQRELSERTIIGRRRAAGVLI